MQGLCLAAKTLEALGHKDSSDLRTVSRTH